jgi:hypothetical protein
MNTQDTNPGSSAQLDNLPSINGQNAALPAHPELKEFISKHCNAVYTCISRLTAIADLDLLEYLTGQVVLDLWHYKGQLSKEQKPGIFIFKILVQHVFAHLKSQGNTNRIEFLRNILLIDSTCYLHILEGGKKLPKPNTLTYLFHQIKRIWKTY